MQMNFSLWLETELPNQIPYIKSFFDNGMDTFALTVWADNLEETGHEDAANILRQIVEKDIPPMQASTYKSRLAVLGKLIDGFFDIFFGSEESLRAWRQSLRGWSLYRGENYLSKEWYISDVSTSPDYLAARSPNHLTPDATSYRLSLDNGKWAVYQNKSGYVVSIDDNSTPLRLRHSDYSPVDVNQVPDDVLLLAFYHTIPRLLRATHPIQIFKQE